MKTIIVNGKYLAETSYRGSGFHSYMKELIKAWSITCQNRYIILLPEKAGLTAEEAGKIYLPPKPVSIVFQTIPQKYPRFENTLIDTEILHRFRPDFFFFPHLELPDQPPPRPYVVVIHDLIPTLFLTPGYLFRGKTPLRMITYKGIADYFRLKKHLPTLRYLISISETTKESLLTLFGEMSRGKIRVIPPAAGEEFRLFNVKGKNREEVLEKYGLGTGQKRFALYFGGYTVRKNYLRLVKAFTEATRRYRRENPSAQPFPLLMAGGQGKKLGKSDAVIPLPKLPEEELRILISEAAFSIYPSLFEGFGLPILESIALNTLPLISDIPSSREIISEDIPFLFFNPYDTEDITRSILHYMQRPEEISRNYDRIKVCQEKYSWRVSAKKIDSLFNEESE